MLVVIECVLVAVGASIAIAFPRLGNRTFTKIEHKFVTFAKHRTRSLVLVGLGTLALRIALMPMLPIPDPGAHDEFSYLLSADTFAHLRLANPPHPMWVYFETFHVNQKPTYVSMYYPAQGLFLALGKVVMGHPIWGVWISTALMCVAICWMLQGWMAPHWALLGGLLSIVRLGTFSYWMNSYWGGSVAALGGALVLGALPRIKQEMKVGDSGLMGLGFALLANSRPYEGLFLSLPVIAALTVLLKRKIFSRRVFFLRVVAPLSLILAITVAAMGYYFSRTTGSPFRTPYAVNAATYRPVGLFPWGQLRPVSYHNAAMHNYYAGWVTQQFRFAVDHPLILLILKAFSTWIFFIGPVLCIPFFAACFVLPYGLRFRDLTRSTQFLLVVLAAVMFANALPICSDPHYVAPITCVFYALVLLAMRTMREWRLRENPVGITMMRFVPLLAGVLLVFPAMSPHLQNRETLPELMTWCSPGPVNTFRHSLQDRLSQTAGLHLVIVHYDAAHDPRNDWVYNGADIDHSKVVWARDMGPAGNLELLHYFANRKVWSVNPDHLPPTLSPYPESVANNGTNTSSGSATFDKLGPERGDL